MAKHTIPSNVLANAPYLGPRHELLVSRGFDLERPTNLSGGEGWLTYVTEVEQRLVIRMHTNGGIKFKSHLIPEFTHLGHGETAWERLIQLITLLPGVSKDEAEVVSDDLIREFGADISDILEKAGAKIAALIALEKYAALTSEDVEEILDTLTTNHDWPVKP